MAYYAWSNIQAGEKSAAPGDTVSASTLGLSEEEFEELVEAEAVREDKYPEGMEDFAGSPNELRKRDLAVSEGTVEIENIEGVGHVEATSSTGKAAATKEK
jgi:hypothetical protein